MMLDPLVKPRDDITLHGKTFLSRDDVLHSSRSRLDGAEMGLDRLDLGTRAFQELDDLFYA